MIAVIALAATFNTTLLVLTAASRLLYAMARAGNLPSPLASVGSRGHAPYVAALAALAVALPFALSGGLGLVASVTDFAVYMTFVAVNLSVVALRRRAPDAVRPFRMPMTLHGIPLTPILALATVFALVGFLPPGALLLGGCTLSLGAVAYVAFARLR
jgi:APA family basic amino acid/polyamine antiporter